MENLSELLKNYFDDFSIIALAPGAVDTDMLKKVVANGGFIKTKTDISEPVNFVKSFISDEIPSVKMNGMFVHVRDTFDSISKEIESKPDLFKLRRIQ